MKYKLTLFLSFLLCHHANADDGPTIIAEASSKLMAELAEAISQQGTTGAISVCSEKAPKIITAVGGKHGGDLRRITEKPRNPKNAADASQKKVLASFASEIKKNQPPTAQSVANPDGTTTFFAPILITNMLCLQCHGDPTKDIASDTLKTIQKLYPQDQATGYKVGDLRGAWAMTFGPKP